MLKTLKHLPNLGLCILVLILLSLALAVHTFRLFRYRTYYFIPVTLSCLLEILGYVFRALSSRQDPYRIN